MRRKPTKIAKKYFNDSKLDYTESKQAHCEICGHVFRDERLVWGSKPSTDFRGMCESCFKFSLLPSVTLLTTKLQTQVSAKTDVRLKAEEAQAMWFNTGQNLAGLFCLAGNGDERALSIFLDLAFLMTEYLDMFARRQPEKLRPHARNKLAWPMYVGPKRGKTNDALLRKIELGRNLRTGKWNPSARSTAVALMIWKWLGQNCDDLKLPPFNSKTGKQWFEQGWTALLYATSGRPEKDEFLRHIGNHRERHSENIGQQKKATSATRETNIRDGIKKQLWQSFKNFIPKPPE